MITFRKIYEFIFSSFRIGDTSHFIDELDQEKIEKLIIIKRSWIYGFFVSLIFILVLIVMSISIYFIIENYISVILMYSMIGAICANVLFGGVSSILYISRFRKIHKKGGILTGIQEIGLIRKALKEEDDAFGRFFNQITANYYIFIIITFFNIYYLVFLNGQYFNISILSGSFFLIIQIILFSYYRRHMIDLEMDYIIVIPNRVYFVDQIGVYGRSQAIKWVTNIRLITSSYPGPLGSLFNYGTIEVVVKGDTTAITNSYHMRYVDNPIEVVNQINKIIEVRWSST